MANNYDLNKLTKLSALKDLAERNKSEISTLRSNSIEAVKVNGAMLTLAGRIADILITEGTTNGTISANNVDVAVHGLAALAYKTNVSIDDLAEALKNKINRGNDAANSIDTLTGDGDGSIAKMIDDAFDDFSTKVTDDNVVNSYKELIDWAAAHGAAAAEMASGISANATAINSLKTLIGTLPEGATSSTIIDYISEAISELSTGGSVTMDDVNSAISTALGDYYSKTDINGMIAADSEVAAMLDEVFADADS